MRRDEPGSVCELSDKRPQASSLRLFWTIDVFNHGRMQRYFTYIDDISCPDLRPDFRPQYGMER